MALQKPFLTALALLMVTLAGCSDGGDGDGATYGFKVVSTPADPVTEPFVFRATVSGDSYEWNLGDGRAPQEGKEVTYTYGFTDGVIKPKLTVIQGGERQEYPAMPITLGTGQNQEPTYEFSLEHDWVTVGEAVTFSGARSSDPDGDPLLFSWFCSKESGIAAAGSGHSHGGGGIAYGAAGADPIPTVLVNGTELPAPDRSVDGDFCAGMGTGGVFSEEATLRGAFTEAGIYKITMLAKDPKSPSQPGSRLVYVTEASAPRYDAPVVIPFEGTFDYGVPQQLDGSLQQAGQADHIKDFPFTVEYKLLAFGLDFESDAGTTGLNEVTYQIIKPNGDPVDSGESSESFDKGADYLKPGQHILRVYGRSGSSLSYSGDITLVYETNPALLWEAPGSH